MEQDDPREEEGSSALPTMSASHHSTVYLTATPQTPPIHMSSTPKPTPSVHRTTYFRIFRR